MCHYDIHCHFPFIFGIVFSLNQRFLCFKVLYNLCLFSSRVNKNEEWTNITNSFNPTLFTLFQISLRFLVWTIKICFTVTIAIYATNFFRVKLLIRKWCCKIQTRHCHCSGREYPTYFHHTQWASRSKLYSICCN